MNQEILLARDEQGRETRYLLEISQEGDHWTSTLARLDERGQPEAAAVAPRFYGLSYEQARRRMVSVLENQYEDILSAGPP